MLCQVHSTFTRFTRYLPFNAEVAFPFLAPPHASVFRARPALCPLPLLSVPCLGRPFVSLPSPARSALCLLCPLFFPLPLLVLSAFCPSLVLSTPPLISSMVLVLRPFSSGSSLPVVGFVCSGRMFYRPSRHIMKAKRSPNKKARHTVASLWISSM